MTQTAIAVKMVLDRWNGSIQNLDKILQSLTDEQLQQETAPGKNRGIYLLGHLVAVHDDMLVLLGMGERQFPALQEPFIKEADKAASNLPAVSELRSMWAKQNEMLKQKFDQTTIDEWFSKHTAVTEEDFVKEPHRCKLNIIITRTSHLQYHSGQIILLKDR